ncbi:DNA repair protein RecN [Cytophagaceae bacterium ABcell3]|nr:DNA repair protein RecN [Cytophagaceae bacterium ABcell3]
MNPLGKIAMLKNLQIKNYTLINHLEINPSRGLNIITGETGAGKSIMLGAIGLLTGNRADTKCLLNEKEKCVIEAVFDISEYHLQAFFEEEDLDYDPQCIIRREISPSNKSRAFVNDTPVTLDILKKLGGKLIDIHSQHETLLLGSSSFQLNILDTCAGNQDMLKSYTSSYKKWSAKKDRLQKLETLLRENIREQEFNTFLYNELSEATLVDGEQEKLEEELQLLENAEEIKTRLQETKYLLEDSETAIVPNLGVGMKNLESLASFSPAYEELQKRIEGCWHELKDISEEISGLEEKVETGAERTEIVRERLNKIFTLQKKHAVRTVAELLEIEQQLAQKLEESSGYSEEVEQLKKELATDHKDLKKQATALTQSRNKVVQPLCKELKELLAEVGIKDATIQIDNIPLDEPGPTGADQIKFLFSANKGIKAQDLKNAASGGEFSRLMLCLKYILAGKTALPTIIFDEIDTGISGEVAIKVGKIMNQMAKGHQVIAISHLPQIAAMGQKHYFVYKDNTSDKTFSNIKELKDKDREHEIARMIGGDNPSETAVKNARELLDFTT